jgi:CspA family cold shock protein
MIGRVKWFDDARGFGFIHVDASRDDVFVHHSQIDGMKGRRTLLEGDRVEFEIVESEKGLAAQSVVVVVPRSEVGHVGT